VDQKACGTLPIVRALRLQPCKELRKLTGVQRNRFIRPVREKTFVALRRGLISAIRTRRVLHTDVCDRLWGCVCELELKSSIVRRTEWGRKGAIESIAHAHDFPCGFGLRFGRPFVRVEGQSRRTPGNAWCDAWAGRVGVMSGLADGDGGRVLWVLPVGWVVRRSYDRSRECCVGWRSGQMTARALGLDEMAGWPKGGASAHLAYCRTDVKTVRPFA